ncbi:MAG: hypothetical protein ACKO5F_01270 [Synechococcus sp.]
MPRNCSLLTLLFAVLYAAALVLFLAGTWGWFGSHRGPLAGVFLLPLGLPWNQFLDPLPAELRLAAAIAAPALNLLLLWILCQRSAQRGVRR